MDNEDTFEPFAGFQERLLADETADDDDETDLEESQVLRNSVCIYGGALVVITLVFSYVRRRYKHAYNLRNWVDKLKTHLADEQYGFLSWMWKVGAITDDELMQETSLDAVCFLRLISMGYRLSCVAMFNSLILLPVYMTAKDSSETSDISDGVVKTTISNLPSGSPRFFATIFCAYIFFGYLMWMIMK